MPALGAVELAARLNLARAQMCLQESNGQPLDECTDRVEFDLRGAQGISKCSWISIVLLKYC